MPNRDNHSLSELKEASFHLNYEINMLFISRVELSNAKNNVLGAIKNAYLLNAILESFLIHTRNLIDFFYIDSPLRRGDDVVAEHFIENWKIQRPLVTALLNDTKSRANKHLAHLTYERRSFEPPTWAFEEIERDLNNVLSNFFEYASEEKLCNEIVTTKNLLNTLR